jgi:tRNA A37 threonylcarbamoyladenosine dehydratase
MSAVTLIHLDTGLCISHKNRPIHALEVEAGRAKSNCETDKFTLEFGGDS